jgi:hypothetical protein
MTPFRMRLFVVVFLAVATAIAANTMYMQQAPHAEHSAVPNLPANSDERSAPATAAIPRHDRIRDHAEAAGQEQPAHFRTLNELRTTEPRALAAPAPERLVRAIQRELNLRGYADEAATGTLDIRTRAAIIAYEFDENMPLTGEPSEALLKSLIFGRAAGKPGPGSAGRFEERRELIVQVQEGLARMGYAPGPADGRLDPQTRDAIRRFESDRNLGARGTLNERVLLEMVIVAGHPLNANG